MVRIHAWAFCIDLHVHLRLASTYMMVTGGLGGQAVKRKEKQKHALVVLVSKGEREGGNVMFCFGVFYTTVVGGVEVQVVV